MKTYEIAIIFKNVLKNQIGILDEASNIWKKIWTGCLWPQNEDNRRMSLWT